MVKITLQKMKFYYFKKVIYVNNVDIEKILISDKFAYDKSKEANANISLDIKLVKNETIIQ